MTRARTVRCLLLAACSLACPLRARAADILFVSDAGADTEIIAVLMMDGHTVTTVIGDFAGGMNPALRMDLSSYDAVFWSANGSGSGDVHTDAEAFANLTRYVMDGGRVFVTGYDSVASPTDPMLIAFLGATGSRDLPPEPGPVIMAENSLTVGVVDIRGLTPTGGYGDRDALTGLMPDTVGVVYSSGSVTEAQWTLRTLGAGEIAYVSNGASGSGATPSWSTTGGGAGAYNAAVRNFAAAAEGASRAPGAPVIEFDSANEANEGEEITITVRVTDEEGDPVTWSWDLDDDGTFGELPGMSSYTVPAGTTDGDASVRVAVRASDGTNTHERRRTIHIVNVDPRITSSPPTMTSVGATVRYAITVEDPAGPNDPPTFALTRGPMDASISAEGVLVWSPDELDVTGPGETIAFEIAVDDGDGGTATQSWEMTVSPNRPPDGMLLLYPANGIVIADPLPRLVVGNGSDPDPADVLRYFFELDDEPTFAEPVLARSGEVEQTVGYTTFQLTEPLAPGVYHWRAWMSDGTVTTEPLTTSFQVVPDPRRDAGIPQGDAALEERDAGPAPMPEPEERSGCACRVPAGSARGRAPGTLVGALAALALLVVRRRR